MESWFAAHERHLLLMRTSPQLMPIRPAVTVTDGMHCAKCVILLMTAKAPTTMTNHLAAVHAGLQNMFSV